MGQGILVLEAIAGIVVVAGLLLYGARRAARGLGQTSFLRQLVAVSIIFVLSIGLVAAVFGYMRLARLAIPGVLAGRCARARALRIGSSGHGFGCVRVSCTAVDRAPFQSRIQKFRGHRLGWLDEAEII